MNFMRKIFALSLLWFLIVPTTFAHGKDEKAAKRAIEELAQSMENFEIGGVEILWMSPTTETNIRVLPEILNTSFSRKLQINQFLGGKLQREFVKNLRGTAFHALDPTSSFDVRWGIKFLALNGGHPVGSLYFNSNGTAGYINNTPASFQQTAIFNWLNTQLGPFFERLDL